MGKYKILVIDDNADEIYLFLSAVIDKLSYDIILAKDGKQGLNQARTLKPDIILLDWVLPEMDGLEVCRILKSDISLRDIPIIMLSAKDEEFDKVLALEMGADDYVSKPFGSRELFSRIKIQIRRSPQITDNQNISEKVLRYPDICIDSNRYEVLVKGNKATFTKTEFLLLFSLAEQPERVFTREQLLYKVWKIDSYGDTRMVDVHILRLRKKLRDISAQHYLKTVHGVGYKFSLE